MAEMMIVNICNNNAPLYMLNEYYQMKNLEGIFHCPIDINQINDDTTSKVMWGTYETEDSKEGVISINSGYSKQKRNDKK